MKLSAFSLNHEIVGLYTVNEELTSKSFIPAFGVLEMSLW